MTTAVRERRKAQATSQPTQKEIVLPELQKLTRADGLLLAEDVVASAETADSPLHSYFEWDNAKAGHQHRLQQARQLITAMVTVLPNVKRPIVAYVSLRDDRQYPQGGYRAIVDVMSNADLRASLLAEALADLSTWERKYKRLTDLAPVFEAAEQVRRRVARPRVVKSGKV